MTNVLDAGSSPLTSDASRALINVLQDGICADIQLVLKHGRNRAALVLIYSGIDAIASLEKPEGPGKVQEHFVDWVETYMEFKDGLVTGVELFAARCGMLHAYSPISDLSKKGKARLIGYTVGGGPDVLESQDVKDLVLLSVEGLAFAFFRGIVNYLEVLKTDSEKRFAITPRLLLMFQELNLNSELITAPNLEQPFSQG
jgi:hypothetical protein